MLNNDDADSLCSFDRAYSARSARGREHGIDRRCDVPGDGAGRTWRLEVDDNLDTLKRWMKGKRVDPGGGNRMNH